MEISAELADVLAFLARRAANAGAIAARGDPVNAEWARDRERQLEVISDELKAGLHHGCAQLMADLAKAGLAAENDRACAHPAGGPHSGREAREALSEAGGDISGAGADSGPERSEWGGRQ